MTRKPLSSVFLVLTLAAGGCTSVTRDDSVTLPGVIAAAVALPAPVLVAPDTVRAGASFTATVSSFGTSCASPENVTVLLGGGQPNIADVSVWDRQQLGGSCTAAIRGISRAIELSFPNVGTATIRVRGRFEARTAAGTDSLVVVEKQLVVRPTA